MILMMTPCFSILGPVAVAVPVQEQPFSIGNVLVSEKAQCCFKCLYIKLFYFSENCFYWFVQVFQSLKSF